MGPPRAVQFWQRAGRVLGGALIGALCGLVVAAFGHTISGSAVAAVVVILLACLIGAWAGRLPGALLGALLGLLTVAFGQVVGGTALGIGVTVAGCALLGGWGAWTGPPTTGVSAPRGQPISPHSRKDLR